MTANSPGDYGFEDTSFQTMGGEVGVRKLVDLFYDEMEREKSAQRVKEMHPPDLNISRDKLAAFLCGWLGGPKRFSEKWGPIRIPAAHAHLHITPEDRDAWLLCMDRAIEAMEVPEDFRAYFKWEIRVPANRVLAASKGPTS